MSDIKIPGVNSDTTIMVEKLMEVERIPLTKLESDLESFSEDKKVWQSLGRTTSEFQSSAKSLFGFQNPFTEHTTVSSKPEVITALASRNAQVEDINLIVKQKATGDRYISKSLSTDFRVPSGTYAFRIGDKDIKLRYRGGKLDDFVRRLNDKDESLLRSSVIRNRSDSQVLLIESVKTGSSNSLFFMEDAVDFGLQSGLIQKARGESGEIQFSQAFMKQWEVENNAFNFVNGGIELKSGANLKLELPTPLEIAPGSQLEIEYYVKTIDKSEYISPPPLGPQIPKMPGITFKDIEIDGSGYSYNKPEWKSPAPPDPINDMNVFYAETDKGVITLPQIEDTNDLKTMTVSLNNGSTIFKSLNLKNKNNYRDIIIKSAKITNPSLRGEYEPVNPLNKASDAIILMNGIEVVRENNKIDDLIAGLTLNIHSSSPENVKLSIKPDTELAKDQLINFVFRYNELVARLSILTNSDSSNTALIDEKENYSDDQREEAIKQLGMFRGEYSLIRFKNTLQTIISSPYETSEGSKFTLLKQLGISTNETSSGGGAADVSRLRGYLEINEEVLDQVLNDSQEAIKDLFGMDTDGDLVIDSGIGKKLDAQLNAYTQTGGFYSTKISRIDLDIENKNDDIKDYKDKLVTYELNLRRKYGNMEALLNQLESSSNSIDNFNKQSSGK